MTARQDMASASAALHELLYQLMRPILWFFWVRGTTYKSWIQWRIERDHLPPGRK